MLLFQPWYKNIKKPCLSCPTLRRGTCCNFVNFLARISPESDWHHYQSSNESPVQGDRLPVGAASAARSSTVLSSEACECAIVQVCKYASKGSTGPGTKFVRIPSSWNLPVYVQKLRWNFLFVSFFENWIIQRSLLWFKPGISHLKVRFKLFQNI